MTIAEKWQREGWLKGRKEGRKQGWQEGWLEGRLENSQETIEFAISVKFGDELAAVLMPFIRQLHDLDELRAIIEGLKQARDIAEFMAVLKACVKISNDQTSQVLKTCEV